MLPSIDEFRSDVERCARRVGWTVAISIGGMFLFLVLAVLAGQIAEDSLGPVPSKFLPPACFLVGLPLMLWGFWRADQHAKRFATLTCRHCAKPLLQSSRIVIASRNCPYCGRPVIRGPDRSSNGQ
jgi:hypothetical protein